MTVYADMVFLLNFLVDFLLLKLTGAIRKQQATGWRLAVAALLGALYAAAMLAPVQSWVFTWLAKLILSTLMVLTAFGFRSRHAFLRNWGVFYFVSFVVGGGMFAAHFALLDHQEVVNGVLVTQGTGMGTPISWLFVAIAFPLVWLYSRATFRSLARRQTMHHYLVQVEVSIRDQSVQATGLIDTGNQLYDPLTKAPVVIAEQNLLQPLLPDSVRRAVQQQDVMTGLTDLPPEWLTRVKLIPYRGVTRGTDFLLAIKPDQVTIAAGERTVTVTRILVGIDDGVLSSDGSYQMILHPTFLEAVG